MERTRTFGITHLLGRLALAACIATGAAQPVLAAERELHMVPYADQELVYESGVASVVSRGEYDVVVRLQSINRKNAWVHVTVFNGTDRAVTVADTAIEATGPAGPLKTLGYAELMKKEERRQFWEALAVGLAAGANAYGAASAGDYTETGTFDGNVNTVGSGGYAHSNVSGSYTAHGTDPAAAQMATARANAENREMIGNVSSAQLARTAALSQSVFRTETIEAGTSYGGAIQVVLPKAARGMSHAIEVAVTVNGERHPFVVHADAPPSHETLQQLAVRTALPRSPKLSARLAAISVVEMLIDDPAYQNRVVSMDIEWTVEQRFDHGPVAGRLVLSGADGSSISLPWTIEAEHATNGQHLQSAAEILLKVGDADSDWLLTQAESGAPVRAVFEAILDHRSFGHVFESWHAQRDGTEESA